MSHTVGIQTPHRPTGSLWPAGFGVLVFSHWLGLWRLPQRVPRLSLKRHLSQECTAKFRRKLAVLKTMQSNKLSHSIICLFHKYIITSFGKHYYSAAVRGGTPTSPASSDIFAHCCSWAISKKRQNEKAIKSRFFLLLLFQLVHLIVLVREAGRQKVGYAAGEITVWAQGYQKQLKYLLRFLRIVL